MPSACCPEGAVVEVRASRADDGPALQDIERLAGQRFRQVGLGYVADHDPAPVAVLAEYAAAGRGWVAVVDGGPVGYALVDVVDGNAHIEQVSVTPDLQGRGLGRALIERVRAWAVEQQRPAITLTTFGDVAWNRPLYEHLGFRVLTEDEIGPGLRARRTAEAKRGLDPATRVCMGLDVTGIGVEIGMGIGIKRRP